MKLNEYINEAPFRRDNPGGEWLKNKQQKTIDAGRSALDHVPDLPDDERPYKSLGSTTGWVDEKVVIPMEKLKRVNGLNAEQHTKRDHSLEWLRKNMRIENNKVMLTKYERASDELVKKRQQEGYKGNEYWVRKEGEFEPMAPFIVVDQDGVPWVNEGNHRIMVANEMGADAIEVEIRWYNGGENVDGPFSPKALGLIEGMNEATVQLKAKHYFNIRAGDLDQNSLLKFKLKKDQNGYYLPQYNTSGRPFDVAYTTLSRTFGTPRTIHTGGTSW